MNAILDNAGEALGTGLPRILAAILVLVLGLVAVRLLVRVLRKAMTAAGLDALAERVGVVDALERLGLQRSLAHTVAVALRIALSITVVLAALTLSGLGFLRESINQAVLFLPQLLVAFALLLAGVVIGTFARHRIERLAGQMELPRELGLVAEVVVIGVFAITALTQIGVSTEILTVLAYILIGATALAAALAVGLGNREVVRAVGAGRVLRASYSPGQEIAVAGVRGEIVALESAAVVLRTGEGTTVRVPNQLVLDSVVEVAGAPEDRSP